MLLFRALHGMLEMYNQNSEHHKGINNPPPTSPRISFSNDFLESSSHSQSHSRSLSHMIRPAAAAYRDAPVSSDFEFSVSNHSMMSADELFFKGRLLPFKESCGGGNKTTTLRDELQNEENDEDFSLRPPKNPTRWKDFLGLKKSHVGFKKSSDKAEESVEKRLGLHEDEQCCKHSQDSDE